MEDIMALAISGKGGNGKSWSRKDGFGMDECWERRGRNKPTRQNTPIRCTVQTKENIQPHSTLIRRNQARHLKEKGKGMARENLANARYPRRGSSNAGIPTHVNMFP